MQDTAYAVKRQQLMIGDIELEVIRSGVGQPLVLLHGMQNIDPQARVLAVLGRHAEIIAPSHPGFGHSARPADFETVYDLVHLYLELLDQLPTTRSRLWDCPSAAGWPRKSRSRVPIALIGSSLSTRLVSRCPTGRRLTFSMCSTPRRRRSRDGAGTIQESGRPTSMR